MKPSQEKNRDILLTPEAITRIGLETEIESTFSNSLILFLWAQIVLHKTIRYQMESI